MAIINQTKKYIQRFETLKSERTTWDTHWNDIAEYIVPRRDAITTDKQKGGKRFDNVVNTHPLHYLDLFASTLHSQVTNPTEKWFKTTIADYDVENDEEARIFLSELEDGIHRIAINSNLSQELGEFYIDFGGFGNAGLYFEEDEEDVIRFRTYNVKHFWIDTDANGRTDKIFMVHRLTGDQIKGKFPNLDEKAKKAIKEEDKTYEVLHIVCKRQDRDPNKKTKDNKPYASTWLLQEGEIVLENSGYDIFPWAVSRFWKQAGEKYGRGPGTTALKNVKQLNQLEIVGLQGKQLAIAPPVLTKRGNIKGINGKGDQRIIKPFSVIEVNNMNNKPEAMNLRTNLSWADNEVERKLEQVSQAFFYDVIMMAQKSGTTATEAMIVNEKQNRILVSVLDRLKNELQKPVINAIIHFGYKQGLLPKVPKHLADKELDIQFTSPLENAMKQQQALGIMRQLEIWAPYQQLAPVFDLVDFDAAFKLTAEANNVPTKILKATSAVRKTRADAQAQKDALQQKQNMMDMAQGTESLARAEQATQGTDGIASALMNKAQSQLG